MTTETAQLFFALLTFVAAAGAIGGFPYAVLLDADGNVISRVSGSRSVADISTG